MKRVLITGASGYLGARLFLDLRNGFELFGTYSRNKIYNKLIKLDVTNRQNVKDLVQKLKPEIIIHSVAKASSDWCEKHPEEARKINVNGTKNVVDSAKETSAKIIFISSFAAINPSNVYGGSKKAGEEIVKSTLDYYLILQPGLIIGCSPNTATKNFFNDVIKNVNNQEDGEYSSTRQYQPTYIGNIADVIKLSITRGISRETIPIASDKVKTRYEVANDILSHFSIKANPKKDRIAKMNAESLDSLRKLNLPTYSYEETIDEVVGELNHQENFKLV